MNELNNGENAAALRHANEVYIAERQQWMADAVEVVTGSREHDPLDIFPAPAEVRAESATLDLSSEQEAALREVAGRFGVGGEADVMSTANHVVVEGGKPWKVEAELVIAQAATTIIVAGSPHRKIGADETSYLQARLGDSAPEQDEYGMIGQLIAIQPEFESLEQPQVLPFGYDISDDHTLITQPTGQLIHIGHLQNRPVILLRIDRENYFDEIEQKNKYRHQPDSAAVVGIISDVLTACGDTESSVGMLTSSTYASRVIDAKRAGLKKGRLFDVGMYGRQTLAEVRGEALAEPTAIEQIPGELHTIYQKLSQLAAEV